MRNSPSLRIFGFFTLLCVASLLAVGCAPDKKQAELKEGFAALDAQQYDQAMTRADAYLASNPTGPGTAEALYLRGRGFEQRVKANPDEAKSNLQSARSAYVEALGHSPSPQLEAYIRTSLGNVAYFQDDYTTALKEWAGVYDKLTEPELKSWVLYRIALSQQRLGRFADADRVFGQVEQEFAGSIPAERSREKRGARGFSVQFATFLNSNSADSAIAALRTQGVVAGKRIDSQGRSVVMAGPVPTYQQAMTIRAAHLSKYPDAIILP